VFLYKLGVLFIAIFCCINVYGQDALLTANRLITKAENYYSKLPAEKIYLHFDKLNYATGDTIWFKAYLLNAATFTPSKLSGKLYIEMINDSSRIVDRRVIPITTGMGEGDFKLDEKNIAEGNYTIRAYTNWLQNFNADYFYYKQLYIGGTLNDESWFVNEQHSITQTGAGNKISLALNLHTPGNAPVANKNVSVSILRGNRQLFKKALVTAANGTLDLSLLLSEKTSPDSLTVVVTETAGRQKMKFPIYASGAAQKIDMQFMPEGGNMVAGMLNKMAFKAIGGDGLGIDVKGTVMNSKNEAVTSFSSTHNGMGSFTIVPVATEQYTAEVTLANGQKRIVPLPKPLLTGSILRVDNSKHPDSLYLYMTATGPAADSSQTYTLLAHTLNSAQYAIPFKYINGYKYFRLARYLLPAGIVNFTVLNSNEHVMNQRKVFISDASNKLSIAAIIDADNYKPQDSIALNINVTDVAGKALQGVLSVAITDDSRVKSQLLEDNIFSRMLLTSELKGYVEEPYWYFNDSALPTKLKALDNLMLAQGWTGVNVTEMTDPDITKPKFEADSVFNLSGAVKGFLNRPATNLKLTLFANGKDIFVIDTKSDNEGKFQFQNLPLSDTVSYTIRASTAKGNSTAAVISLNEFKVPGPYLAQRLPAQLPWYVKADTTILNYLAVKKIEASRINLSGTKGKVLNEVVIKDRRSLNVKGVNGQDLYYADAIIDTESFVKAGRISLYDYLRLNVPGFHIRLNSRGDSFAMKGNIVADFIIDGQGINSFIQGIPGVPNSFFNQQKSFLEVSAADVKKAWIYHDMDQSGKKIISYVFIQTRSGAGPQFPSTANNYIPPFPCVYRHAILQSQVQSQYPG
jgi:hypothetical protein